MIKRSTYLSKILAVKNNEKLKIILGVKRSGKTTLISQFIEELKIKKVKTEQIIYLNFEQPDFQKVLNADQEWLHHLEKTLNNEQNYYLFLDEISQLNEATIPTIEKLRTKKNVDLYLISSNNSFVRHLEESLLENEISFIHIFPLSFREFLSGYTFEYFIPSTRNYWNVYLRSSFPHVITLKNDNDRIIYLSDLIDGILINDLMLHVSITNVHLLKYLVQFLFHHIGREISINKIATQLICSKFPKVYPKMIDKYIQGLLNTFLFYKLNRYDIKEKQIIYTTPKYYIADIGLQMIDYKINEKEMAFAVENIVLLELKKRGYEVFFGKIGDYQIDFVAKKDDFFEYYQVSHLPLNPITLAKKKRPIDKLRNGYPRFLLTLDQAGVRGNYDGLRQLSIFEWLMQTEVQESDS